MQRQQIPPVADDDNTRTLNDGSSTAELTLDNNR